MKHIVPLILIVLALTSCAEQSSQETTITYETFGAFSPSSTARQELMISPQQEVFTIYDIDGGITFSKTTPLTKEQYQTVLKIFQDNNFESLKENYSSEVQVMDAGQARFTLKTSMKSKSVLLDANIPEGYPEEVKNLQTYMGNYVGKYWDEYFQQAPVRASFQPMQCDPTPWQKAYDDGKIIFKKPPTQEELILAYYALEGVTMKEVTKVEQPDVIVCQACSICPTTYYYEALVSKEDAGALDGWVVP